MEIKILDSKGEELKEGDLVSVKVFRNSSSYGSWGQCRNQFHGQWLIDGVIANENNEPSVKLNELQLRLLKEPHGQERKSQNVWFHDETLTGGVNCKITKIDKPLIRARRAERRRLNKE